MKLVDVAARSEKEAQQIFRKVMTALRKTKEHIAFHELAKQSDGSWYVTIETNIPEWVCDQLETAIKNSPNAKFVGATAHKGWFDWAANTYIKDAATAEFKF